jgi:uncharacterized membrane protein YidH (DUF202 family)
MLTPFGAFRLLLWTFFLYEGLYLGGLFLAEENETESEGIIINEVQLLLAEKRTSLAAMRTGIAVFALPLSVLSVLIATSKYYDITHVLHLLVPLLLISTALVFLGAYLIIRAIIKIRHYDRIILELKRKHSKIAPFID